MKHLSLRKGIYILIAVGFFTMVQCQQNGNVAEEQTVQVETKPLKQMVNEGALLVDVRTPSEFQSGSVEGAVNIPLDEIKSRLPEMQGKNGVILFCRTGNRSSTAQRILENNGIPNVINGINSAYIERELNQ